MTGHTQITEEEAKGKRCKNDLIKNCIGTKCIGWPECKKLWEDFQDEEK